MSTGRAVPAKEGIDVEKGEADGISSVRLPMWDRIGDRTNSIALSLRAGQHAANEAPRRPNKVTRLTGFPEKQGSRNLATWILAMPDAIRGHVVSIIGELIGTFSFLFFAFAATQLAVNSNHPPHSAAAQSPSMLLYISLAFGFSLAVNAWTFFRVSGGLFNPAVNFALCLVGALTWVRGGLLFIAQIVGALIAAAIVSALFPGDFLVETTLGTEAEVAQGLFIEAFATFELVLVIFMLAAEKHEGRFLAPVGIGIALFVTELASVAYTGGSLNPVRSFAPAVVNHSFPSYHWIYWLGPLLGATVAALTYKLLKILEFETANPESDGSAPQQNHNRSPREHLSIHPADRRPPTPPVFTLGNKSKESDDDTDLGDTRTWTVRDSMRSLSGFGEGLILPKAQGNMKKTRGKFPY